MVRYINHVTRLPTAIIMSVTKLTTATRQEMLIFVDSIYIDRSIPESTSMPSMD